MSKIISIATSVPAYQHQQADIGSFAAGVYAQTDTDKRKLGFLYRHSGIDTRYSVLPDYSLPPASRIFYSKHPNLDPIPTIDQRMQWYQQTACELSLQAIHQCLQNNLSPQEITHLITVSCTGMSAPGLDLEIMEALQLTPTISRTSINFMGCYAAIHALKQADYICRAFPDARVLIVCTELCTLHFQKEPTIDNITSTLLFADGCAAMLVTGNAHPTKGIRLDHFYAEVAFKGKQDMSWQISTTGFLMTLTGYVPDLVKEDFGQLMGKALQQAQLQQADINHWCIHPGGKKILESIEKSAGLSEGALDHSYSILREYGNMSSPTVIFVLHRIWQQLKAQDNSETQRIFGAAFGPGLTMETFIATYA